FMCREALKHYLAGFESNTEAVERFVDDGDASELNNAEKVLEALKRVRVCDPACGSGAYLLGMMQELLRLRAALFTSKRLDDESVYRRKREIIENNLYGVDKDKFAVQIACLRLWLSLAIEADNPQPLPNLDFKIGCGDSLTAPSPSGNEQQLDLSRGVLVRDYRQAKGEFVRCNEPERKKKLREQIDALRAEIALSLKHQPKRPSQQKIELARREADTLQKQIKQATAAKNHAQAASAQKKLEALKRQLAAWEGVKEEAEPGFDWAVEFAEVFSPETDNAQRWDGGFSFMNEVDRQPMFTDQKVNNEGGGFDIVLANPPYVRADPQFKHIRNEKERQSAIEEWKNFRAFLVKSKIYQTLHEKWDLYIPFLERAYQLLRQGGDMVFIIPDSYNAAKYCGKSHQFFLEKSTIQRVDFCTDIPLFKAGVANTILHFDKQLTEAGHPPLRVRRWGESPEEFDNRVVAIKRNQRNPLISQELVAGSAKC